MGRIWRFVRFVMTGSYYALSVRLRLRYTPPAERDVLRAQLQQAGCRALCRVLGLDVWRTGAVPERGVCLLVSNHLGLIDPILLGALLPVVFVAKAETRRWPVIGWVLRGFGILFVDRERRMRSAAFAEQVRDTLRRGVRVLVFPEGTTGDGTTVRPFKTGAFAAVAGKAQGVVVPVFIHRVPPAGRPAASAGLVWTGKPLVRHVWQLLGAQGVGVEVRIGAPIEADCRDRKELARLAHAAVTALGTPLPRTTPEAVP